MTNVITSPEHIELNRHAIIEASAGTGKTYTLEHLVTRLVVEKDIPLSKILVVTFTEKATSEMKDRIRSNLIRQHSESTDPLKKKRMKAAIDEFDSATISTIHGLCQRMLKQYAFENRFYFESEVVDDKELVNRLFVQAFTRIWPKEKLAFLPKAIQSHLAEKDFYQRDVVQLALNVTSVKSIDITLTDSPKQTLGGASDFDVPLTKLKNLLLFETNQKPDNNRFMVSWMETKVHHSTRKSIKNNILLPLIQSFSEGDAEASLKWLMNNRKDVLNVIEKLLDSEKMDEGMAESCKQVHQTLAEIFAQSERLVNEMIRDAVERLQGGLREHKETNAQLSFNDMLRHFHRALLANSDRSEILLKALRQQFQVALVDEFQDTDDVQWEIFHQIFVKAGGTHCLMIIGDPKQAIYGFRGADIHTYFKAKQILLEQGAKAYVLGTNYRSSEAMVRFFNQFFDNEWFSPKPDDKDKTKGISEDIGISYDAVQFSNRSDRSWLPGPAFWQVDVGSGSVGRQRISWAREIAKQIQALRREFSPADLPLNQIAVLCRKKSETSIVEQALDEAQIPYSQYKKAGLYDSDEAFHLSLLLRTLADPENSSRLKKSLYTMFFRHKTEERFEIASDSSETETPQILEDLLELANERNWPAFFQHLLEQTNCLQHHPSEPDSPWPIASDRRATNLYHLVQSLLTAVYQNHLDMVGLSDWFEEKRKNSGTQETEEDLHRLETEHPKVQILTIHKSKGLEFDVVFLMGCLDTIKTHGKINKYHTPNGDLRYDLTTQHKDKALLEEVQEGRRLLYVALTRARSRLYLPKGQDANTENRVKVTEVLECIQNQLQQKQITPEHEQTGQDQHHTEVVKQRTVTPEVYPDDRLFFTTPECGWKRNFQFLSYTSLAHHETGPNEKTIQYGDEVSAGIAETEDHLSDKPSPSDIYTLPGGKETGSLLHDLLELSDWQQVINAPQPSDLLQNADFCRLVEAKMVQYGMSDSQAPISIATLVWRALRVHLEGSSENLLGSIPPHQRSSEQEFLLHISPGCQAEHFQPTETNQRKFATGDCFVTGFIDLVFQHQGKYYILDWKSNRLENYQRNQLEAAMRDMKYDMQYKIYAVALKRWFEVTQPGKSFDELFGGVYYIFLRGLQQGCNDGIFFDKPDANKLDQFAQATLKSRRS